MDISIAHDESIIFVHQKNRETIQTTTANGGNNPLLNLVTKVATFVWHLRNAPGINDSTQICHVLNDVKLTNITKNDIFDHLRTTGHVIGEERLGSNPNEI